MKRTLFFRLYTRLALGFVAALITLFFLFSYHAFEHFLSTQQEVLRSWAISLSESGFSGFNSLPQEKALPSQGVISASGVSYRVLSAQESRLVIAGSTQAQTIDTLVNPNLVLQGFFQETWQLDREQKNIVFYHARRLMDKRGTPAILMTWFSPEQAFSAYRIFRIRILVFFLAVYGVILGLIGLVLRRLSTPVQELVHTAREAAAGRMDSRVFLTGDDEYRILADSINHITEQNQDLLQELTLEKEGLQAIISSLKEALWLIDTDERIVFSNPAFREWLGRRNIEQHPYWEFIRDRRLDLLLQQVRHDHRPVQEEMPILGRQVVFSAQYIPVSSRILVVLNDISDIRAAQAMKKDLISSVSHELKTPLTAIKGFVETLRAADPSEEQDRYLQIIERNTNRLTRIVQDLLILAHLEDASQVMELEKVDLREVIARVIQIFTQKCEEKDLYLDVDIPEKLVLKTDPFKLEQVFINLIDNAFKYTETGGISITASRQKDCIKVCIRDTGIGIPQDQQGRIFERFYVVDKSRSRRQGGTGLGLSIVRHIMTLLHGEVSLESTPGRGSIFTLSFPIFF